MAIKPHDENSTLSVKEEWQPPETIEEAEQRKDELVSEIQGIEAQLGDHGITEDGSGYRMPLAEFEAWRSRAKWAKRHKVDELRNLKAWIKEHNSAAPSSYAEMSTRQLKKAIFDMTGELARRVPKDQD